MKDAQLTLMISPDRHKAFAGDLIRQHYQLIAIASSLGSLQTHRVDGLHQALYVLPYRIHYVNCLRLSTHTTQVSEHKSQSNILLDRPGIIMIIVRHTLGQTQHHHVAVYLELSSLFVLQMS